MLLLLQAHSTPCGEVELVATSNRRAPIELIVDGTTVAEERGRVSWKGVGGDELVSITAQSKRKERHVTLAPTVDAKFSVEFPIGMFGGWSCAPIVAIDTRSWPVHR